MRRWLQWIPVGLLLLLSLSLAWARQHPATSQWLVFISSRDGGPDLYRMNSDGSDVRKLTQTRAYYYDPSWSPDGQWIVFTADTAHSADIYVMRANGSMSKPIANGPNDDTNPRWSPDGQWIAFNSGYDIYMVRRDGSDLQQLTASPGQFDFEPMWSPDGKWLYFFSGSGLRVVNNLYRIEIKTRQTEEVASGVNRLIPVLWARDGSYMLIVKGDIDSTLHRTRPDGSEDQMLIQRLVQQMAWCPDEECVLLIINRLPYKLTIGDGPPERIDDPRLIAYLRGVPGPDGSRVAFAQETADNRTDVFIYYADSIQNLSNHPANDYDPQWIPIHDLDWHPLWYVSGAVIALIAKRGLRIMV